MGCRRSRGQPAGGERRLAAPIAIRSSVTELSVLSSMVDRFAGDKILFGSSFHQG